LLSSYTFSIVVYCRFSFTYFPLFSFLDLLFFTIICSAAVSVVAFLFFTCVFLYTNNMMMEYFSFFVPRSIRHLCALAIVAPGPVPLLLVFINFKV